MNLRDYQEQSIEDTREAFLHHLRVLLVAPTGSGKTVMFCYMTSRARAKGKRVLLIVHRSELVDQISDTLEKFGVAHQRIEAGCMYCDSTAMIYVANVHTLVRRQGFTDILKPDLIIIDEASHAVAGSWSKVSQRFDRVRQLGVTATPSRLDGRGLGDAFDCMVMGPSVRELTDMGYLSPVTYYSPPAADLSGARKRMGEFERSVINEFTKPKIVGNAIEHYQRYAPGLRAVTFCASVEHARITARMFEESGIPSAALHGSLPRAVRKQIVSQFRGGELVNVTSCDLISEGFDLPEISCGILLRPTASLALYLQQIGRCLRTFAGKEQAVILDHVGNVPRHLPADVDRDWTLEGSPKGDGVAEAPVRICQQCFAVNAISAKFCSQCGFEFVAERREIEEVDGELVEYRLLPKHELSMKRMQLMKQARKRGIENPGQWVMNLTR